MLLEHKHIRLIMAFPVSRETPQSLNIFPRKAGNDITLSHFALLQIPLNNLIQTNHFTCICCICLLCYMYSILHYLQLLQTAVHWYNVNLPNSRISCLSQSCHCTLYMAFYVFPMSMIVIAFRLTSFSHSLFNMPLMFLSGKSSNKDKPSECCHVVEACHEQLFNYFSLYSMLWALSPLSLKNPASVFFQVTCHPRLSFNHETTSLICHPNWLRAAFSLHR